MRTCTRRMERRREEMIRKGPWMAEEDEVLMAYVQKNGPRDWSSIRSKGLLPRTGKSCRLRWVNKLKPDLKTGCKFSADEERVVIQLQARFGNRWARIATYLPGRTDNDVKNFWSTRRKRLARTSQTSNQTKPQKNSGKPHEALQQATCSEGSSLNSIVVDQESCSNHPCQLPYMEDPEVIKMVPLPGLMQPSLLCLEPSPPQFEFTLPEQKPHIESPLQFSFPQLPQPTLDLPPLLPETQDLVPGLGDTGALADMFGHQETSAPEHGSQYVNLLFSGLKTNYQCGGKGENENPATPDSFFDDFPTDVFDYIESLPSSSEW